MSNSYIRLKITGKNPILFFKINILGKVSYKNFKEINRKEILLDIKYNDYLQLKDIRSSYDIKIIKYNGLLKIYNIFLDNKTLLI